MARIRAFRGVRPNDALADEIIAPPYDVLNRAEARAIARDAERSFLHVTRPDADLPDDVGVHSSEAYAAARAALDRFRADGWLQQDQAPCFYLYAQRWRGRVQVGLMALCDVAAYDRGEIKRHELTRPDKEQDRVDHMLALDAQVGLVFLAYRDDLADLRALLASLVDRHPPAWQVDTDDGVRHALHVVSAPADIDALTAAFDRVPTLYIADGHHRSAAASRVGALRAGAGGSDAFLAGIFPDSQLQVLAYNRVIADLAGHTPDALLAAIGQHYVVHPDVAPQPAARGDVTMYLQGRWWGLRPKPGVVPDDDPVGRLDVAVLQDRVLGPLLGIRDPRRDTRVQFVGGIRGSAALSAAVDGGDAAVAFHLFPTGMDQLFDVADADLLMPPKSTWFEPKLRGGVVMHCFVAD